MEHSAWSQKETSSQPACVAADFLNICPGSEMQIAELENRSSKNIILVRTLVAVAEQNSLSLSTAYYTTTSTRLRNKFQIWQCRFAVGNLALQKCAQSPGCTKLISAFAQSPRRTNSHLFFPFPFSHRPVLVPLPTIQREWQLQRRAQCAPATISPSPIRRQAMVIGSIPPHPSVRPSVHQKLAGRHVVQS